jgi:hypothetical protein
LLEINENENGKTIEELIKLWNTKKTDKPLAVLIKKKKRAEMQPIKSIKKEHCYWSRGGKGIIRKYY